MKSLDLAKVQEACLGQRSSPPPSPADFPSLHHVRFSTLMLLQVLYFSESLVPTARKALCDPLEEVREAAAKTFEQLHSTIGHQALEDILPFLLKQLVSDSASPLPGGVPPSPWGPHARADCQGSQCRFQREWVHRMALTLWGVRWGAGKEFRIKTVKMIQDLRKRMKKMQEVFTKDLEELKNKQTDEQYTRRKSVAE